MIFKTCMNQSDTSNPSSKTCLSTGIPTPAASLHFKIAASSILVVLHLNYLYDEDRKMGTL